jgi:hypothetical protein
VTKNGITMGRSGYEVPPQEREPEPVGVIEQEPMDAPEPAEQGKRRQAPFGYVYCHNKLVPRGGKEHKEKLRVEKESYARRVMRKDNEEWG